MCRGKNTEEKYRCRLAPIVNLADNRLMKKKIVSSSSDVMGGTPVFSGTRVPVQTFIEYIEGGHSIDDFLDGFPSVKRKQLIAFLEEAQKKMTKQAA